MLLVTNWALLVDVFISFIKKSSYNGTATHYEGVLLHSIISPIKAAASIAWPKFISTNNITGKAAKRRRINYLKPVQDSIINIMKSIIILHTVIAYDNKGNSIIIHLLANISVGWFDIMPFMHPPFS